jgi:hypothetical protein
LPAALLKGADLKPTFCLLLLVVFFSTANAQKTYADGGVLDLRRWNFAEQGFFELNGEWKFYMSELVSPDQIRTSKTQADFINFPSTWNDLSKSLNPGNGFATYYLTVLVSERGPLAIEIPHFYSSYALFINGKKISENGIVGTTKETTKPQWLPRTINFQPTSDTLDIVIHAANFHHAKGGVRETIRIGVRDKLIAKSQIAATSTTILCGALVVIALAFTAIFFFRPESSALYFAALCLTWAVREAFSNNYILTAAFPSFPWEIAVRIEYITLYLTMVWGALFLASIFPQDVSPVFKYLFVVANLLFVFFTIFTGTSLFTQFLPVYLSFAAVLLLYVVYVLIHAIVYDRKGVWVIVSCIMLGVIVFSYDLVAYEALTSYNALIIHAGYLGIFLLLGLCLTIQYGFVRKGSGRSDMLTYDDLYGTRK